MENIIIIGNGGSNLDKKNGKEIDKFTKVVRLGQFHLDGYEDYVGKKTDIISTSHWKLNRKRLAKTKTIICVPFYSKESYKESNFSLGFKTIFLIMKLFPGSKITVTGFDFFLTGWYWKKDHNRDIANCHPYIYEKLYLKRMIIDKTIHLL